MYTCQTDNGLSMKSVAHCTPLDTWFSTAWHSVTQDGLTIWLLNASSKNTKLVSQHYLQATTLDVGVIAICCALTRSRGAQKRAGLQSLQDDLRSQRWHVGQSQKCWFQVRSQSCHTVQTI